jgi:hypothetical protein
MSDFKLTKCSSYSQGRRRKIQAMRVENDGSSIFDIIKALFIAGSGRHL